MMLLNARQSSTREGDHAQKKELLNQIFHKIKAPELSYASFLFRFPFLLRPSTPLYARVQDRWLQVFGTPI